ncbi:hypothetical protein [Rhodomicrobium udaipurense]|nr:hypothetical protein [Rhodomicrobium udaipurense]
MRNFIIGALLVALVALAAFYIYDQNTISVEKPTIPNVRVN